MKKILNESILSKLKKPHHSGRNGSYNGDGTVASLEKQRSLAEPCRLSHPLSDLTEEDIERLNIEAQDYQIVHGGVLKAVLQEDDYPNASGTAIGISLHPSPFPRRLFDEAVALQPMFQELYAAVSNDSQWLSEVMHDLIEADPLIKALWTVFETACEKNPGSRATVSDPVGDITTNPRRRHRPSAAIFRSDYMIHADSENCLRLKQVEFNTIACAGSIHGERVNNMHQYFHRSGLYAALGTETSLSCDPGVQLDIPRVENVKGIAAVLEDAHKLYLQISGASYHGLNPKHCVLMIVQANNFNVADERPIEYALWARDLPIPCYRVEWGGNILRTTEIDEQGILHFTHPHLHHRYEVSVIYFRAGFEPHEYVDQTGLDVRLRLEMSNAIQFPDVLTHLVGSKKVQQALCMSGAVEHFTQGDKADRLRQSFMPMYPLDASDAGVVGKKLARDPSQSEFYILKPNRDGGGHNIYGRDIPPFLEQLPEDRWAEYVLMEKIEPVVGRNSLVSSAGVWLGDVVAELGIWGGAIWDSNGATVKMLDNCQIGCSVRSKNPHINEMSVVKGYGCFDSVMLVDDEQLGN